MEMHLTKEPLDVYICQNCASKHSPPTHCDELMILVHSNDLYYWECISTTDDTTIELDHCCEHPYIDELNDY